MKCILKSLYSPKIYFMCTKAVTRGAKGLVVACNTATIAAVPENVTSVSVYSDFVGIEPALKPAALAWNSAKFV